MNQRELIKLAGRLMTCPTAPYHEAGVRRVVETICAEHGLKAKRDAFGNVLIRVGSAQYGRPIAFAAHLDHPGFAVLKRLGPRRWLAQFNGTVPDAYFRRGLPVRLLPGNLPARIDRRAAAPKQFELVADPVVGAVPAFGVWEMGDFAVRGDQIHGRACDDLLGVTSALGALIDLQRSRARVHAIGLISRAEEVGFQGALALAASGVLPKRTLVVSLETSKEIPPVKMGSGVIVRVGDRSSIFGSNATRFVTEVAGELAKTAKGKPAGFPFQRALMSGGTCEATAYQEFGYETAAVCVALGNYHNCTPDGRIREEFVSISDLSGMVQLLAECAMQMKNYDRLVGRLPARLQDLLRQARRNLRKG